MPGRATANRNRRNSVREPKPSWVRALRTLTGNESDDIRFNEALGRWEFLLMSADGVSRSQFWGRFDQTVDPLSGLHPYRELDDVTMIEALANLEKTFVANPHDGAGTPADEVWRRMEHNADVDRYRYKQGGEAFAYLAAHEGRRPRKQSSNLVLDSHR